MAIEKCINEFDVDDVIFEEGSTGRELFVVLDGQVEIAKMNGASKTIIVTLGKGEFFGEMAVIDGSSRSATAIAAAPKTRVMRINPRPLRLSGQPAAGLCADDHGCAQQAVAGLERRQLQNRGQLMGDRKPSPFKTLLDSEVCTLIRRQRMSIKSVSRTARPTPIWCAAVRAPS
ncbi:cyclic nucleotide-binding domain-containing protein [Bradyrhizobium sp. TZ2]